MEYGHPVEHRSILRKAIIPWFLMRYYNIIPKMSRKGLTLNILLFFNVFVRVQLQLTVPLHLWPLSRDTWGYDIYKNRLTAHLHGNVYRPGANGGTAFHLNGSSYIDIDIEAQEAWRSWSFVMHVYLDTNTGTLFEYFDDNNQTIFVLSLLNGLGTIETKKSSQTTNTLSQHLNINQWFQIGIGQNVGENTLVINLNDREIVDEDDLPYTISILEKGTLRIGRRRSVSSSIKGAVSWVRLYPAFVDSTRMGQAETHSQRVDALEHYTGPYGCMYIPCQNGAVCSENMANNYSCSCVVGFTGEYCETEINLCDGIFCQNGGTCRSNVSEYWCLCGNDFTGKHCETIIDKFHDDGYFFLRSTNRAPNSSQMLESGVRTSSRECGVYCVKTTGCVSFTVQFQKPLRLCSLYSGFYEPDNVLVNSKYYVLRQFM